MGRPSAILEIIWIVWLCSWVAASFWSGRTQSRIGSLDTWTYRFVMIVGGFLLVPLTAQVLGEKPIWPVGHGAAYALATVMLAGTLFHLVGAHLPGTAVVERDHPQGGPSHRRHRPLRRGAASDLHGAYPGAAGDGGCGGDHHGTNWRRPRHLWHLSQSKLRGALFARRARPGCLQLVPSSGPDAHSVFEARLAARVARFCPEVLKLICTASGPRRRGTTICVPTASGVPSGK